MKIEYVCPQCGGELQTEVQFTDPPIQITICSKCGWSYSYRDIEETVKVPYSSPPGSCKNCANHPSNGGSGICNCILGGNTVYC